MKMPVNKTAAWARNIRGTKQYNHGKYKDDRFTAVGDSREQIDCCLHCRRPVDKCTGECKTVIELRKNNG